jgi:tRNA(adenine34) deaminase
MQTITSAANYIGGKYLNDCTLYVTLEPCLMCAGALQWTHITKIVYGATDDKKGYSKINQPVLHPKTTVTKGILEDECSKLLKDFFKIKRK